jgi:hypothetical protein
MSASCCYCFFLSVGRIKYAPRYWSNALKCQPIGRFYSMDDRQGRADPKQSFTPAEQFKPDVYITLLRPLAAAGLSRQMCNHIHFFEICLDGQSEGETDTQLIRTAHLNFWQVWFRKVPIVGQSLLYPHANLHSTVEKILERS